MAAPILTIITGIWFIIMVTNILYAALRFTKEEIAFLQKTKGLSGI